MKAAFEEIGHLAVTFAQAGCAPGKVCKVSQNGAVTPCIAGEKFCGKAEWIRNGFAAVQVEGFAELTYTGTAPGLGFVSLCADGLGGVKTGSGKEYLVVSVDTAAKNVTIKL